ncbi:unnamed protein product [Lampetra planeri]
MRGATHHHVGSQEAGHSVSHHSPHIHAATATEPLTKFTLAQRPKCGTLLNRNLESQRIETLHTRHVTRNPFRIRAVLRASFGLSERRAKTPPRTQTAQVERPKQADA